MAASLNKRTESLIMNDEKFLDGRAMAKSIRESVKAEILQLKESGIIPRMAAVLATDDPSAHSYAQTKQKMAANLGIQFDLVDLRISPTQKELESKISALANDVEVHGALLEFPLAADLDGQKALEFLPAHKDIDGLTSANLGLTMAGSESDAILSATAQACIELAEVEGSVKGKRIGLVGRGRTVGRPLAAMLINRQATVTVCNSQTKDLSEVLRDCAVVIVAIGKPLFITKDLLKSGQIVIDAGINVVGDSMVGDVDTDGAMGKVHRITPVPGGVGPLTTAIIFRNLLQAIKIQKSKGYL